MFYNVTVELNLEPLRRILQDTFPDEKIDIHSSRDSITLNGTVSTKDVADRAVALSATFAKTVVKVDESATARSAISLVETVPFKVRESRELWMSIFSPG